MGSLNIEHPYLESPNPSVTDFVVVFAVDRAVKPGGAALPSRCRQGTVDLDRQGIQFEVFEVGLPSLPETVLDIGVTLQAGGRELI